MNELDNRSGVLYLQSYQEWIVIAMPKKSQGA